jgi:hypothetical protein
MLMKRLITLIAALAVFMTAFAAPGLADGGTDGTLNVVHGIPGAVVDVCASGDATGNAYAKVAPNFEFKDIATLELPEGAYDAFVQLATGDDACDASNALPGLAATGLFLPGGANVSVVANLTGVDDAPFELSVFVNNTDPLRRWVSRFTVRHVADAPTVDVYSGRYARWTWKNFDDVAQGDEGSRKLWAGRRYIGLALEDSQSRADIAIGPIESYLAPTANNIYYAVGSLEDGTFDIIQQVIEVERKRSWWWNWK